MGALSKHFNKTAVGAGAVGLLKHSVDTNNLEIVKLLLGHGADVNAAKPQPSPSVPQPSTLPLGHPAGYVPPKRPTRDSLEKQLESVGEIEVLPAVNVRKRTAAEREQDRSVRLPPAAKIKKRDPKG